MRDDHIEQVISVVKGTIGQPSEQRELMLRKRLKDLNLKSGPEGYIKERRDPVAIWISNARKWATNKCLMGSRVHIDMVVRALPLPEGTDRRAIGGVFKHPDFQRVGTIRTRKPGGGYRTSGEFILSSQELPKDAITDW
tara:strand:- start:260 stop:676 length:417 start_codon:yes stop_codon:yes gene_type:complete